ncbi:MAG TPA: hypothetical protein VK933_05650 [Longimicrobiales bacterium]|nr:hypothetical protein [Longimicrobiales bacterium]
MMRNHWRYLLLLAAFPAATAAQETARRPDSFFLERSSIFYRFPGDDLAFEGQIAPHLFFYRSDPWGDEGDVFLKPVWSWATSLTPMVRLRMMSTLSHPVRTPSYMPRPLLDWQLFRASVIDTIWADRQLAEVPLRLWGLTFTPWAHHSNGQDGCLFEHQVRPPGSEECTGELPPDDTLATNKIDGSFSTNFIRLAVGYAWFAAPDTAADALVGADRCTYELGVEYHPIGYLVGGISEEQAAYYARTQATFGMEWGRSLHGQLLVGADVRWLNRPAPRVSNWAYSGEVNYMPKFLSGWGAFMRYYSGMDYYNLGFLEEISYLQVGFVWDLGATPRFVQRSVVNTAQPPPPYKRNALLDRILPAVFDKVCSKLH